MVSIASVKNYSIDKVFDLLDREKGIADGQFENFNTALSALFDAAFDARVLNLEDVDKRNINYPFPTETAKWKFKLIDSVINETNRAYGFAFENYIRAVKALFKAVVPAAERTVLIFDRFTQAVMERIEEQGSKMRFVLIDGKIARAVENNGIPIFPDGRKKFMLVFDCTLRDLQRVFFYSSRDRSIDRSLPIKPVVPNGPSINLTCALTMPENLSEEYKMQDLRRTVGF